MTAGRAPGIVCPLVVALCVALFAASSWGAPTCPDGDTVPGIDVSKWQGTVDWEEVAASGVRFAFIRTNHGLEDVDERFEENWQGAKAAGIRRGAYQFFWPWQDPIEQADLLIELMGPLEPGDLPPVIDVEADEARETMVYGLDPPPPVTSPEDYADVVWEFLDHVEAEIGVRPILYSYQYFWNTRLAGTDEFDEAGYPFWFANYNVACPTLPTGWSDWQFWQTSSTGSVPGISGNVDTNLFNGDEDLLATFGYGYGVAPDAGVAAPDAGDAPDAGADAGTVVDDAGVAAPDAGTPHADAGLEPPPPDDTPRAHAAHRAVAEEAAACACATPARSPPAALALLLLAFASSSRGRRRRAPRP